MNILNEPPPIPTSLVSVVPPPLPTDDVLPPIPGESRELPDLPGPTVSHQASVTVPELKLVENEAQLLVEFPENVFLKRFPWLASLFCLLAVGGLFLVIYFFQKTQPELKGLRPSDYQRLHQLADVSHKLSFDAKGKELWLRVPHYYQGSVSSPEI